MRIKGVWRFLWAKYRLLVAKKYTTVAGTLVFFLLLSLVPMAFWAVLLFRALPMQTDRLLRLPVFSSVQSILSIVRREVETAASGASIFLIATSLYSATSLFYQMRKSGEIIYGVSHTRQGVKMRLGAIAVLFCVMAVVVLALLVFTMASSVVSFFLAGWVETLIQSLLWLVVAFLIVVLLNAYICPYRVPLHRFLVGALFTIAFWSVAVFGFAIYLKIGNLHRLYGAFSMLIAFMLWGYVMMIGFVAGIIFNADRIQSLPALRAPATRRGTTP